MNQLSEEMKKELRKDAQANSLNATEYRVLLGEIDRLINKHVLNSIESVHGAKPEHDYDVDGKEDFS